jgi:hypothetical protein
MRGGGKAKVNVMREFRNAFAGRMSLPAGFFDRHESAC